MTESWGFASQLTDEEVARGHMMRKRPDGCCCQRSHWKTDQMATPLIPVYSSGKLLRQEVVSRLLRVCVWKPESCWKLEECTVIPSSREKNDQKRKTPGIFLVNTGK